MKPYILSLITSTTLLPNLAHASSSDALSLFWLESALLIAAITFMFSSKLAMTRRLTVLLVYLVSTVAAFWLTSDLPYANNLILVNASCVLAPLVSSVVAWIWCSKQSHT